MIMNIKQRKIPDYTKDKIEQHHKRTWSIQKFSWLATVKSYKHFDFIVCYKNQSLAQALPTDGAIVGSSVLVMFTLTISLSAIKRLLMSLSLLGTIRSS